MFQAKYVCLQNLKCLITSGQLCRSISPKLCAIVSKPMVVMYINVCPWFSALISLKSIMDYGTLCLSAVLRLEVVHWHNIKLGERNVQESWSGSIGCLGALRWARWPEPRIGLTECRADLGTSGTPTDLGDLVTSVAVLCWHCTKEEVTWKRIPVSLLQEFQLILYPFVSH